MAPQGTPKRPLPKDKHKKQSWIKRDAARKAKQEAYAASFEANSVTAEEGGQ